MTFIWPVMLYSLLLIPLFGAGYWLLLRHRAQQTRNLGALGIMRNQAGQQIGFRRHVPPLVFLLAISLLLFSLARPELPVSLPRVEGTVILAFDVSNSMMADDLDPTRIEAAKAAARTFVENQPDTIQIGVVAFSNGGLIVQQPTDDETAVLETINRLTPQGGTSLGQGIFTSLNAIVGESIPLDPEVLEAEGPLGVQVEPHPSAVIVLLSDGENANPPEPLEMAQIAANASVRIFTVGIGSPEGAIIEVDGFSVVTQLNEAPLQEIASLTNGAYFYAENEEALQEIYDSIDLQLTIAGEQMEITSIVAMIAFFIFLIGSVLSQMWFGRAI